MKHIIRLILFILGGGLLGCLYYYFFGCDGPCPITSNPYLTMGYFSLVGALLYPLTVSDKKKTS